MTAAVRAGGDRRPSSVDGAFGLPAVIAHRGAAADAPENTLAAFRRAAAAGAPWVELDARLTADGVAVVFHDDSLRRIAGRAERVEDLPLAVVAAVDAGRWFAPNFAGEPIPTLAAALRALAAMGLGVNVELKATPDGDERLVAATAAAIATAWPVAAGAILVSSFRADVLAVVARLMPAIPRGLIVDRLPDGWRETIVALGCVSLHHNADTLDGDRVRRIKEAGVSLAAWTVNDPRLATVLWDWGVDAVFTDRPAALLAARRGKNS